MDGSSRQASGHLQDSLQGRRLVYSSRCGRILLNNVTVQNRGVDWADGNNVYWQHKVRSWPDKHLTPCLHVMNRYHEVCGGPIEPTLVYVLMSSHSGLYW